MEIFDHVGTIFWFLMMLFSVFVACMSEKKWKKMMNQEEKVHFYGDF